ncbi:MAG: KH domain-containing protein [Polyangiaceae bacterium]|nr:KH domain-containing protein [Polyangiaceae bacterium]
MEPFDKHRPSGPDDAFRLERASSRPSVREDRAEHIAELDGVNEEDPMSDLDDECFGSDDADVQQEQFAQPERSADEAAGRRQQREHRPQGDERGDTAHDFLVAVLRDMGMEVSVRRRRPRPDSAPDEIHLEVVGRDVGRVIGKKGQVLAALQYLVNRVTNKPGTARRHVVLDAEGYRHRRETSLATMARKLGEQAVREGKIVTFEPMSPRDRRVVHLALAKLPDVVTKSDGEGEERRVRIIPVRR